MQDISQKFSANQNFLEVHAVFKRKQREKERKGIILNIKA